MHDVVYLAHEEARRRHADPSVLRITLYYALPVWGRKYLLLAGLIPIDS